MSKMAITFIDDMNSLKQLLSSFSLPLIYVYLFNVRMASDMEAKN